ncbi:MAG: hypothetical protein QM784_00090 [Polyangiaceae bacterium]
MRKRLQSSVDAELEERQAARLRDAEAGHRDGVPLTRPASNVTATASP